MIVFLDFEASSLTKQSYPIEVAWVFEDGRSQSLLIRPNPDWTDWADEAARIHGITRSQLENEGTDVRDVVAVMMEALSGNQLYASSPSWDGKWLSVLLRGAGVPRHALRLRKSDDLFAEAAQDILKNQSMDIDIRAMVAAVVAKTKPTDPPHRALPDAKLDLTRLRLVQDAARSIAVP
jgi:hypothetical protein